ncbi:Lrp/AsnC ligand binding domain-containing protein [Catenibacterium mitsuokai]|uniref:Lrp/AsnC ligand binding domain-containing protein n=1 Tax=Catenibacterium mitsuokai TaxID=100886 RepID=UPI0030B97200
MDILNKNDIVTQIYRVTGRDKLHVHAMASSNEEMERFLHNFPFVCHRRKPTAFRR